MVLKKSKQKEGHSIKFVFFQAALATIAVMSIFVAINALSESVSASSMPKLVFSAALILIVVLFIALKKPDWRFYFRQNPRHTSLMLVQVLLLLLFAVEFLQVLEFNSTSENPFAEFSFSGEPAPYIIMGLILFALLTLNYALKKKNSLTFRVQQDAKFILRESAKIKVKRTKENPFVLILFAFEIVYVLIIALALANYFEPGEEIVPWGSLEAQIGFPLDPAIKTLFHLAGFFVLTALVLFFHSYSKQFDSIKLRGRKIKKESEKKEKIKTKKKKKR